MSCDKFCHNTSMHCPTYRYVMCACVCMLSCICTYVCGTFMWSPEGDIGPLAYLLRQGLSLNLELISPGSYPSQHALGLLCAASGVLRFQVIITPVQLFYMCAGNPDSGPHPFSASTLSIELFPQISITSSQCLGFNSILLFFSKNTFYAGGN